MMTETICSTTLNFRLRTENCRTMESPTAAFALSFIWYLLSPSDPFRRRSSISSGEADWFAVSSEQIVEMFNLNIQVEKDGRDGVV